MITFYFGKLMSYKDDNSSYRLSQGACGGIITVQASATPPVNIFMTPE